MSKIGLEPVQHRGGLFEILYRWMTGAYILFVEKRD